MVGLSQSPVIGTLHPGIFGAFSEYGFSPYFEVQDMRLVKLKLTVIGAATMLAACGGGGGSTPTIAGLAATGAAMANASVVAKCTNGAAVSGTTGEDGSFSLELSGGQVAPCLVQVTKGAMVLHSFASAAGRLNVTPVTDLIVAKALGADPAEAFLNFDTAKASKISLGLTKAKSDSVAELASLLPGAGTLTGDPLTSTFKVGDADDKVLDALKVKMDLAGVKPEDLRLSAVSGLTLSAASTAGSDRGSLIDVATVLTTLSIAQIDGGTAASGLQPISGKAKCDVKVVALNYKTIGVNGEAANASGVMLVPSGAAAACTAASTLVAYAKGTDVEKPHTLANPSDSQTFMLAAIYAAQGHTVVATDYLGFAKSTYAYHPYLHAASEASSVIDSIRAARNAVSATGAKLSGKVMVTGYSQGGHSSMAAHRAIERNNASEINLILGAHMAGPYNLAASLKVPDAIAGVQFFVPYLVVAWQKAYGNIYSTAASVFKAPYVGYIEDLLPSPTLTYTTLVTSGKLPGASNETPNQARDAVFQSAFIADSQTNNSNALYLAAKKNDLQGWSPKAKTLLCGGAGDPTVPYAVHLTPTKADFASRQLTNVTTVDVDPYVQAAFGVVSGSTKVAPGPTDPVAFATYYGNYHGTYEPPFCNAQAKGMLDAVLAAL